MYRVNHLFFHDVKICFFSVWQNIISTVVENGSVDRKAKECVNVLMCWCGGVGGE